MPQKQIDPFLPISQTPHSNLKQLDELEATLKINFVSLLLCLNFKILKFVKLQPLYDIVVEDSKRLFLQKK